MKIDELAASHSDDEDSKPLKHLQIDYDDKLEEEIPGNQCVSVFVDLSTRRSRAASAKEMKQHLVNIRTILLNTNATPIRYHDGTAYICAVCPEQYPTVLDLKNHVLEEHDNVDKATFLEKSRLTTYVAKLDITDLQCNICRQKIDSNLTSLLHHLKDVHQKPMHLDIPNHILPFKFNGKDFDCVECTKTYEHFKLIQEHMSSHYRNYVCDICDAPFVNKRNMQSHRIRHKKGEFPCSHCSKIFETKRKKLDHEKFVHGGDWKRNKCPHCQAKFTNYNNKRAHMVKEHGAEPPLIKCFVCDKIFSTRAALSLHKKENTH
ncbi:unnamed protein product [Leptosia nina]|uniref:C2H2-type domain-containing protein n=1 Tax=Leptosia nina TaxID=320188 RepID=A0AAV1K128_9NEOP